jgi:hypothetical protein
VNGDKVGLESGGRKEDGVHLCGGSVNAIFDFEIGEHIKGEK